MKISKKVNILLCIIMAIIVSMALITLPFADTLDSYNSDIEPLSSDSEILTNGSYSTSGGAIIIAPEGGSVEEPTVTPEGSKEEPTVTPEGSKEEPTVPPEGTNADATVSKQETSGEASKFNSSDNVNEATEGSEDSTGEEEVNLSENGKDALEDKETTPVPKQYSYEDERIIVTAVLSDTTAIPADAKLCITPITQEGGDNEYSRIEETVNKNVQKENKEVTDFLAYDIHFATDDGTEYEPENGKVTIQIQYKNDVFNEEIKKITEGIKVLHLEETDTGIQVEDVTEAVAVADIGEPTSNTEVSQESESEAVPEASEDTQMNEDTASGTEGAIESIDTVQFVTDSFSTFVVTGITTSSAVFKVGLQFLKADGTLDTGINGTYYLNITGTYDYRYNVQLNVTSGKANATITGLYDANGNMNGSKLYPLTVGNYTAVLFKYPTTCSENFKWDQNNPANVTECYQYISGSEIYENYILGAFPSSVTVANDSGDFVITANARTGIQFSRTDLRNALEPVRPYAVFANTFDIVGDMEGSIAVKLANIGHNFGNSDKNRANFTYSNYYSINVNKQYIGTTSKTFTFGLFNSSGTLLSSKAITLPNNGSDTGSISFDVNDTVKNYSVYELGADNSKLMPGSANDGCKLTSATEGSVTTTSSILNNTSYIETFNATVSTPLLPGLATNKNNLVVGNQYTITSDGINTNVALNGKTLISAVNAYCNVSKASGTFPINFSATLQQMGNLSVQLAQAISSDTVMVKNMTIAELNAKTQAELNFNTYGRMLLLNIDATGQSDISLCPGKQLVVNNYYSGGWVPEVGNIVVNVYTKSGSSYAAYTGTIHNAGDVMGTLLTPYARIASLSRSFNGNIVADYVWNGDAEIHGNTMGIKLESKIYDFINSELPTYILPATGSIGTTPFFFIGGFLIAFAGIMMVIRYNKRRHKYDQGRLRNKHEDG